jgi:formate dehydrogenase major subunit
MDGLKLLLNHGAAKRRRARAEGKMKSEHEDEKTSDENDDAVNPVSLRSTRRQFIKGLTTGTLAIGALAQSGCAPVIPPLKTRGATETTTVCPFCGVGCGQVVATREGKVINIEGDPAHPISEGTLCSKGASGIQVVNNSRRLQKVLYRAPGGKGWEEKSWDWTLERIAARVKETRDKTFRTSVEGRVVNRTEAIACLGGSALDNEEAYLLVKLMRALGLVYVEHQARL